MYFYKETVLGTGTGLKEGRVGEGNCRSSQKRSLGRAKASERSLGEAERKDVSPSLAPYELRFALLNNVIFFHKFCLVLVGLLWSLLRIKKKKPFHFTIFF